MDNEIDFYKLLGVEIDVGDKELTKAYRVKALQYHPDKNRDNPDASRIFHDIKSAYDLLTDPKRRAEYDEKLRAQIAKRQRQSAISSHRKRMKSELEEDERAARQVREAERMRQQNIHQEAARFRREAQKHEERHDRRMRENIRRMDEEANARAAEETMDEVDDLDRSIRIRWDTNSGISYDRETLETLFSPFGELEEVVLAPTGLRNLKKRESATASALLVFKSIASAHMLMNAKHTDAQLSAFSRFWAKGAESQAVQSIIGSLNAKAAESTQMADSSSAARDGASRLPEIEDIDLRNVPGISMSFADFEALTLMRMRQQ
ncbi:hypothetical protein LPJ53_000143 [Coemansia erecta]|uniref:J domain-containing protein n=1 Tax=Coemansia erecta TaxID=147472 RepID=A0A9W8CU39_9FUNG|nr:hypothetical protein LPJ53_000143 [Coemansia erecta]